MRVAVLGAGLQGACVAMELAGAGIDVDLYDQNDRCLSQASAHNEGKIHLGYVYANDPTLHTARTMVKGAIHFAPLMRRWLGRLDTVPVSSPFHYAVHTGSLLSVDEVKFYLQRTHAIATEESQGVSVDYFGSDFRQPPARLSKGQCDLLFDPSTVAAAFRTSEIAIDPEALAALVRVRITDEARIQCILQARVHRVEPDAGTVAVHFELGGNRMRESYDHVVNTLWEGRLAIDRSAGLEPDRPWLYRVKHYLRVEAPGIAGHIPSTTVVLGAFGDTVAYGDSTLYLSWYPAGMRGASSALQPPAWPLVLDDAEADEVRRAILDGLLRIVPALADIPAARLASSQVRGGIIFAWGQTDIHELDSGLHARHAIGPRSHGRYHTIDTGKLTMAPYFGKMLADHILQNTSYV